MNPNIHLDFWAQTDVGKKRDHNEDNFLVDKKLKLFIVADGMGGHAAGEVASSMCVKKVREALVSNQDLLERFVAGEEGVSRADIQRILEHAVQSACSQIFERAQKETEKRGMGTTCSVLLLTEERGFIAHVGDSRIYLMRQGQVHQLSDDHSLINELARRGKINVEELEESVYQNFKNAVTRAVGVYESVEVDTFDFDVLPGDQFFLCSDGQSAYVEEENKIAELLSIKDVKEATQSFIDVANAGGGHDNITTIIVHVAEGEAEDPRIKDVSLRLEVLKGMPFFQYLSYKELVRILNITNVQTYTRGELIIEEGEDGFGHGTLRRSRGTIGTRGPR